MLAPIAALDLANVTGGTLPWYHAYENEHEQPSRKPWGQDIPDDPQPSHMPWIHDDSRSCIGALWHACPPLPKGDK